MSCKICIGGSGADPDGCAKEQPLKIQGAADVNTALCSGTELAECSEIMRCCGCGSPDERRE